MPARRQRGTLSSHMARCISIALLGCFLAAQLSAGVQYYVSPTGNNVSDGSIFTPWLTIQHAADIAGPGDTVIVLDGWYRERVRSKTNGVAGNPVTFRAQNRYGARVWGFQFNHSYHIVDGFASSLSGIDVGQIPNNEGVFQVWRPSTNISVINSYVHDFALYDLQTDPNQVYAFKVDAQVVEPTYNVTPGNLLWSNNIVTNLSFCMVGIYGYNVLSISNKYAMSNERDVFKLFGNGVTLRGEYITNLNESVIIHDHTDFVQTNGDDGPTAWATNIVIEGCYVVNSATQIGQLEQKGAMIGGWKFRNNIFARCGLSCNVDIVDCEWEGNTFYRCTTNTSGPILLNNNVKGQATNAKVRNNLFIECGSDPSNNQFGWYAFENNDGGWQSTVTANYNMVAGTGGGAKRSDLFTEANGINGGNVMFVDAANNNFALQQTSPARATGIYIPGSVDFFGRLRPNPPSMGAIEFGASGNTIIVQPTKCK